LRSPTPRSGPRKRTCRAFFDRTIETVRAAATVWGYIHQQPVPQFTFIDSSRFTCSDLARFVKEWLSSEPSEVPEESMSFHSIKKMLPDSCECMAKDLLDKLVEGLQQPSPVMPKGYLRFVKQQTHRLFSKGWDASYESFCRSTSPPLSATRKFPGSSCPSSGSRSTGGCLNIMTSGGGQGKWHSHADFLDVVLRGDGVPDILEGTLMVVQSAGKPRPLSKFDAEALYLKPLHKTIYSWISKERWLCRGKPDLRFFRDAGFREGAGVLVSGDYKSATDGLSKLVAESILETLLANAVFVPDDIKGFAIECLSPIMHNKDDTLEPFVPTRGQMMGSYLSFPLLCLQNYFAFLWTIRSAGLDSREIPVGINGDDIMFQSSRSFAGHWMETVCLLGLEVERTKTGVAEDHGSLNSTLFRWKDGFLCEAHTVRFGMLRKSEHLNCLGKSFDDFVGNFDGDLRYRVGRAFFKAHIGELRSSRFSLPDMGFRGLLALRLARKFSLDAVDTGMPAPPRVHDMGLPPDLVSEVPLQSLSQEERGMSADETASWKWNSGWAPVNLSREAILWALSSTRFEPDPFLGNSWPFWVSDAEFAWRVERSRPFARRTRSSLRKAYLAPRPVREFERVMHSIALLTLPDFGRGPLPTYEEAMLATVPAV